MNKVSKYQEFGPQFGPNHTGIAVHEDEAEAMQRATRMFKPSSTGTRFADDAERVRHARDMGGVGLGSVPTPTEAPARELTAEQFALLLDKLGGRLAFERTGVRLYEALVAKHEAFGGFPGGPTRDDLIEILEDEHRHFKMLTEIVDELGGDPTAVTPAADVGGVAAMGIGQIIADARTTLLQGLETILIAELADRDGWALLIQLGRRMLDESMVAKFEQAERTEQQHVARVRAWVQAGSNLAVEQQAARPDQELS